MWMEAPEIPRAVRPGVVQVEQRANGQYPEYYRRQLCLNRTQASAPSPLSTQRSIITMRHVREHLQHLPVVEGELIDDEESIEASSHPGLLRGNTGSTLDLSDQSLNSSAESLNQSNPMMQVKCSLRSRLGRMLKKKSPRIPRRSKELHREESQESASSQTMTAPMRLQSEDVANANPTTGIQRNGSERDFRLSDATLPEDVSFEPDEEGEAPIHPTSTQDEVDLEDQLVEQIQSIFPHVNRHETHRLIREGQSVRDILGQLVGSRNSSQGSATDGDDDLLAAIEVKVKLIQDAFPNVNVDRSYALLRDKSLQTIMSELADESLNSASEFPTSSTGTSYPTTAELTDIRKVQDVFPHVEKHEALTMLRTASLSSVLMQLTLSSPHQDSNPAGVVEQGGHHHDDAGNQNAADQLCELFPELSSRDAQEMLRERSMSRAMDHLLENQPSAR